MAGKAENKYRVKEQKNKIIIDEFTEQEYIKRLIKHCDMQLSNARSNIRQLQKEKLLLQSINKKWKSK